MYLSDFITLDDERFYVAVDTNTATIRLERVSNKAFERFIVNVLTMPDPLDAVSDKEVSA